RRRKTIALEEINQFLFGEIDASDNSDCDESSTSEDEAKISTNMDEVDYLEMNDENYEKLVWTPDVPN
ncbi:hypothetical protein AVEN_256070-1, partial [Araneus ventricosus]